MKLWNFQRDDLILCLKFQEDHLSIVCLSCFFINYEIKIDQRLGEGFLLNLPQSHVITYTQKLATMCRHLNISSSENPLQCCSYSHCRYQGISKYLLLYAIHSSMVNNQIMFITRWEKPLSSFISMLVACYIVYTNPGMKFIILCLKKKLQQVSITIFRMIWSGKVDKISIPWEKSFIYRKSIILYVCNIAFYIRFP